MDGQTTRETQYAGNERLTITYNTYEDYPFGDYIAELPLQYLRLHKSCVSKISPHYSLSEAVWNFYILLSTVSHGYILSAVQAAWIIFFGQFW